MTSKAVVERNRLDALRAEIANAIAIEKAYNVPDLCVTLGLLPAATEEHQAAAFSSKRSFVKPMLLDKNEADLLRIAERTLEHVDHAPLETLVTEMTKHADMRVSVLVRKDVLGALEGAGPLFGDQPVLTALERIFGSQVVAGEYLRPTSSRAGPITQWYIKNDDWSHRELLEHCGALDCPQTTFFKLIEEILHPLSRRDAEQLQLAEAISQCLRRDGFAVQATAAESGYPIFEVVRATAGVRGPMKNLIFASIGAKPELVIRDAVSNDVEIVKNAHQVLVFDRTLPSSGMLSWAVLQQWWAELNGLADGPAAKAGLYRRLLQSVKQTGSPGEFAVFRAYYEHFGPRPPDRLPALIPQVYLHYDPYTKRERGDEQVLARQRMDFLLLLENGVRIVLEVDGQHHYGVEAGGKFQANPGLYASMAAEDRRLRLAGYEVYRFGGHEFKGVRLDHDEVDAESAGLVVDFFTRLFKRHGVK